MIAAAAALTPAQRRGYAARFVGIPYRVPSSDCYGLAQWFLGDLGYRLPWGEERPRGKFDLLAAAIIHPALRRVDAAEWGDILIYAAAPGFLHGSLAICLDEEMVLTTRRETKSVILRQSRIRQPLLGAFRVREEVRHG